MPMEALKLFIVLWVFCLTLEDPGDRCVPTLLGRTVFSQTDVWIEVRGWGGRSLWNGLGQKYTTRL